MKRVRTDDPQRAHRLRLNDTLFHVLGTHYCGNAEELLELLLEAGLCEKVHTFQVEIQKLGASHTKDHISVELDKSLTGHMTEVKRVLEKEEGLKPWEAQLYRFEDDWDGTYGSSEQQQAALLPNDAVFSGPCSLQLVAQSECPETPCSPPPFPFARFHGSLVHMLGVRKLLVAA